MPNAYAEPRAVAPSKKSRGVANVLAALSRRVGRDENPATKKIKRRDLMFILQNLATLVGNGIALPKALATLERERSMKRHSRMLEIIRYKVESGEPFSTALAGFPKIFGQLMVNQIRVGERAGELVRAVNRVAEQLEKNGNLRAQIVKKLAYPIVLVCAGGVSVTFMLMFVIPVFEQTYRESKVPLPMITQSLIDLSHVIMRYGWMIALVVTIWSIVFVRARRNPEVAYAVDRWILRIPLFGSWFRDLAVLQFVDVLNNLLESGFTIVDALGVAVGSVGNRAVRQSVQELQAAVTRGERFSRELDRQGNLFPPVVTQLVIVGERTGGLAGATAHIREHLRRQIERTTNVMVGTIEPVLTISLAVAIALILLAIYLPMFDMIGAMNPQGKS